MKKLLTILSLVFLIVLSFGEEFLKMPLNRQIEITGYFGEYRTGNEIVGPHFHVGIDFSTGGLNGIEILAPAAGYVEYFYINDPLYGNGLVLYVPSFKNKITGENGIKVNFAHLQSIGSTKNSNGELLRKIFDKLLKSSDNEYRKVNLSDNRIEFKAGEALALSGDTGNVPPHLHLEILDVDENIYINPASYFDFDYSETEMGITGVKINGEDYTDKTVFPISEDSDFYIRPEVKLRYNINPKIISVRLNNTSVFQIDFSYILTDDLFSPEKIYIDSTNSEYWYSLINDSKLSIIVSNLWKDIDFSTSYEGEIMIEDNWGNQYIRSFRMVPGGG
ncbi:MAG: hypothetical protein PWQ77_443 [Kosmotogales bacterium]|nr:hypothetical protein [Kosmotogales bacterium]